MGFGVVFGLFYLLWALHMDCLVVYQRLGYAFTELIVGDEGFFAEVFKIVSDSFDFATVAGKAVSGIGDEGDLGCRQFFAKITELIGECAFNLSDEVTGDFGVLLFVVWKNKVHFI